MRLDTSKHNMNIASQTIVLKITCCNNIQSNLADTGHQPLLYYCDYSWVCCLILSFSINFLVRTGLTLSPLSYLI